VVCWGICDDPAPHHPTSQGGKEVFTGARVVHQGVTKRTKADQRAVVGGVAGDDLIAGCPVKPLSDEGG
jgi:hypothetical protein